MQRLDFHFKDIQTFLIKFKQIFFWLHSSILQLRRVLKEALSVNGEVLTVQWLPCSSVASRCVAVLNTKNLLKIKEILLKNPKVSSLGMPKKYFSSETHSFQNQILQKYK